MYTAIELLNGELAAPPPFIELKVGANGISMMELHEKPTTQRYVASLEIKTSRREHPSQPMPVALVRQALESGIAVVGGPISMFDDDETHVRSRRVKREFCDRRGEPSGKWGSSVISHSVCVVGYCEVAGRGYLITKDTQDPEELGMARSGVALFPVEEAQINEVYVVSPAAAPAAPGGGKKRARAA